MLRWSTGQNGLGWAAVGEEPGKQAAAEHARLGHAGLALLDAADAWVPPGGLGEGWTVMSCSG